MGSLVQAHLGAQIWQGEYQSGQMGQTVNLLSYDFGGSNPSSPTLYEFIFLYAEIAQLVEHDLAKVGVAGPSPVFRSPE